MLAPVDHRAAGRAAPSPGGAGTCRRGAYALARGNPLDEAHQLQVQERDALLERARPSTSCRRRSAGCRAGTGGCPGRAPARAGRGRPRRPARRRRGARRSAAASSPAPPVSAGAQVVVGDLDSRSRRSASARSPSSRRRGAALVARQRRGRAPSGPAARPGHAGGAQRGGGLVAAVAAVRLVGALARRAPPSPSRAAKRDSCISAPAPRASRTGSSSRRTQRSSSPRKSVSRHRGVVVLGADRPARLGARPALVEHVAVAREADREGERRPLAAARHRRHDRGGVDAAAQEGAVGHVGHHLAPDGLGEALGQLARQLVARRPSSGVARAPRGSWSPSARRPLGHQHATRRAAC